MNAPTILDIPAAPRRFTPGDRLPLNVFKASEPLIQAGNQAEHVGRTGKSPLTGWQALGRLIDQLSALQTQGFGYAEPVVQDLLGTADRLKAAQLLYDSLTDELAELGRRLSWLVECDTGAISPEAVDPPRGYEQRG